VEILALPYRWLLLLLLLLLWPRVASPCLCSPPGSERGGNGGSDSGGRAGRDGGRRVPVPQVAVPRQRGKVELELGVVEHDLADEGHGGDDKQPVLRHHL
jgi:hypothetical protein